MAQEMYGLARTLALPTKQIGERSLTIYLAISGFSMNA
jgi:hypothetical protein